MRRHDTLGKSSAHFSRLSWQTGPVPANNVRRQRREHTEAEILRVGRLRLAEVGAAALSVRAIARELGMVSSAIYRYVTSRDDLLTLLVVDAYTELGDAVDEAVNRAGDLPADRFLALARAVRRWALAEPSRYALIFGSPVPGYHAPAERTTAAGIRVPAQIIAIFAAARFTGEPPRLSAPVTADIDAIRTALGVSPSRTAVLYGARAWSTLIGAVSLEVFGQYGVDTLASPGDYFDAILRQEVERMVHKP
jgi:AcrR family transcriptional regulator